MSSSSLTMDTEEQQVSLQVNTVVTNLHQSQGFTTSISIDLKTVIEEVTEDENGTVRFLRSYRGPAPPNPHIILKPIDFTANHLSELLHHQQVPQCRELGRIIALGVSRSLDHDKSLQEPFLVKVNVVFIKEWFVVFPPVSDPSMEVLQRFVEEQRVNLKDLDEEKEGNETCSICIESLITKSHENITRMPKCLHMFHQDCIFEWLKRQNSCPLCRRLPYHETEIHLG